MNILEELAVRISWISLALSPKARFQCTPDCNEGHTYLWPCRARIKKPKKSTIGAYHDKNTPYLIEIRPEGLFFEGHRIDKENP